MIPLKAKSVLVISRDDRYFALADRHIKLDYGQIVTCAQALRAQDAGS
jgi:putative ATP-binding cassette transporter